MEKAKLTKRLVESLRPEAARYEVHDTDMTGFFIRVYPNGRKAFFCYYRTPTGQRRKPRVGDYHPETFKVETARTEAGKLLSRVKLGKDPSAERKEARKAETVAQFAENFLKDAEKRNKARTIEDYRRQLALHILPAWGNKKLTSIRPADVQSLHRKLAEPRTITLSPKGDAKPYKRTLGGPGGANRYLSLLKAMFATAERWGQIPAGTNPARDAKPFPERSRERYLTPDELARLAEALAATEAEQSATPWAIGAVRLLLFTGCRRDEILTLKWEHVDAAARCLRLADSKTGAKVVYLNTPALEVLKTLADLREAENPHVIIGQKKGSRLVNLTKPWYRIRERAGLPDLRLHDLRHVYAGMGAALGLGLPVVGKLLGHSQPSTTQRYANLAPDPVSQAAEKIGAALLEAMEKGKAKVVPVGGAESVEKRGDESAG